MSDALDILKQRLARGEITEEEFDRLEARVGSAQAEPAATTVATAPIATKGWLARNWPYAVGGFIGVIIVASIVGRASDGLTVGNVSASGGSVSFRVSNSKSTSGDIVYWVEQNGIEMCVRKSRVNANFNHTINFSCRDMREGQFSLRTGWASADTGRANIAIRVD